MLSHLARFVHEDVSAARDLDGDALLHRGRHPLRLRHERSLRYPPELVRQHVRGDGETGVVDPAAALALLL